MTEVFSGDAIADHHITPQYRKRRLYIPLRTLNVVTTMLGGGGVRACLVDQPRTTQRPSVSIDSAEELAISAATGTVWKAKLHSTDADRRSSSTVQARRCESTGDVLSRGEGISGDVTDSDRKSRP